MFLTLLPSLLVNKAMCSSYLEVRCVSDKDDYVSDDLCVPQRGQAPTLTQI